MKWEKVPIIISWLRIRTQKMMVYLNKESKDLKNGKISFKRSK